MELLQFILFCRLIADDSLEFLLKIFLYTWKLNIFLFNLESISYGLDEIIYSKIINSRKNIFAPISVNHKI